MSNTICGILISFSSVLLSCTQNGGEIGSIFGLWSLNDFYSNNVHISGEECDGYHIKFQSDVVQYLRNMPFHDTQLFTGKWHIKQDSLFLSFPDIAYRPTSRPGIVQSKENDVEVVFPITTSLGFKINTLSNSVLDISRTTSDGIELRYYFKKLN